MFARAPIFIQRLQHVSPEPKIPSNLSQDLPIIYYEGKNKELFMAGIDIRIKAAQIALAGWKIGQKKAGHVPSSEEKMVKWNELFGKIDEQASELEARGAKIDSFMLAKKMFPLETRSYRTSKIHVTVEHWTVRDARASDAPKIRITVGPYIVRNATPADAPTDALPILASAALRVFNN